MAIAYQEDVRKEIRDMVRGASTEDLVVMKEEIEFELSRRDRRP